MPGPMFMKPISVSNEVRVQDPDTKRWDKCGVIIFKEKTQGLLSQATVKSRLLAHPTFHEAELYNGHCPAAVRLTRASFRVI